MCDWCLQVMEVKGTAMLPLYFTSGTSPDFFLFSNVSNLYSQRSIQSVNIIVYGSSELFIKTPVHFQNRQPTYLNDERYVLE